MRHNFLSPPSYTATYIYMTSYCGRIELRHKKSHFPCLPHNLDMSNQFCPILGRRLTACLSLLLMMSPNQQSMTWGFRVSEDSYCDIQSYDTVYHAWVKDTVFPYGRVHKYSWYVVVTQVGHIVIYSRWHPSVLDDRFLRGSHCYTIHHLVVARVRGRLSVSKLLNFLYPSALDAA